MGRRKEQNLAPPVRIAVRDVKWSKLELRLLWLIQRKVDKFIKQNKEQIIRWLRLTEYWGITPVLGRSAYKQMILGKSVTLYWEKASSASEIHVSCHQIFFNLSLLWDQEHSEGRVGEDRSGKQPTTYLNQRQHWPEQS